MSQSPPSLRVLVIDDDPDVRVSLSALLRALGHQVEEAVSASQGIERALATRPDLALIDLTLDDELDGCELVRRLRASPRGKNLRLVSLTGHRRAADRDRALAAGFDAYLVKPVAENELLALLAGCEARSADV